MNAPDLFSKLIGTWAGTVRTWFEPGVLADESGIRGEIRSVLGGLFVRHEYESTINGKPRKGEELIGFNSVTGLYQCAWVDDFHMSYAIMFSEGIATARGFNVKGEYAFAAGEPLWGWRTECELIDDSSLRITAFNISPNGDEAKAVETRYTRTGGR